MATEYVTQLLLSVYFSVFSWLLRKALSDRRPGYGDAMIS